MTAAGRGNHPLRAEQKDEAAKGRVVAGEGRRFEMLKGELVVSLVVEADFVQVRDQIPVAFQVDRVAERLIDGGQLAAGERPVRGCAAPCPPRRR